MLIGLWGFPQVVTVTNTRHLSAHPIHDTTVMLTNGDRPKGAYAREHSGPEKITSDDGVETLFRLARCSRGAFIFPLRLRDRPE